MGVEGVGDLARKVQESDLAADPKNLKVGFALEEQYLAGRTKLLGMKRQIANLGSFLDAVRAVYNKWKNQENVLRLSSSEFSIDVRQSNSMYDLAKGFQPTQEFSEEMFNKFLVKIRQLLNNSQLLKEQNSPGVHILFAPFRKIKTEEKLFEVATCGVFRNIKVL